MEIVQTQFDADGFTLKGTLNLPDTDMNSPVVIGSHGLEGSQDSAKQKVLSQLLPENGIAFFRFDHRGCGKSQGRFIEDTSLDKRTRDLTAAVAHVMAMKKTSSRFALFGSSMGGATCINAWQILEAKGFPPMGGVLFAAPVISHTIKNIPTQANENHPTLPLSFFTENLLFNLLDRARGLHHLLIFHGDADDIVPVSNAHDLYDAIQPPKEKIIHSGGSHQMSEPKHQADFETRSLAWYQDIFNV
ncbi:MAG: damage-inducible protein CinA [Desulfobacterales bacterium]|nr:MAG: damage-inducible protein CinA [Desulfobacterales bacterium]